MANTFWQDLLPAMPELEYYGTLASKNLTPTQGNYWNNQYSNIYNKYLGQLGKTAMAGGIPNLTFQQYLGSFPWLRQWNALSPYQRGLNPSSMSPSMRWLIYQ